MDSKITRKGFAFNEKDIENIGKIKERFGVTFDSEAIRIALRRTVE